MSDADYSYTVSQQPIARCSGDAVLADANKVRLTVTPLATAFVVYNGSGRPILGRDARGKYWQHRIDILVARMKRRYDKRRVTRR